MYLITTNYNAPPSVTDALIPLLSTYFWWSQQATTDLSKVTKEIWETGFFKLQIEYPPDAQQTAKQC